MLAVDLNRFSITAWSHGISEGQGLQTWLGFPDAIEAVVDQVDAIAAEAVFVIAITAASYKDFASQCEALGAVFAFPELEAWQRRANSLVNLEVDKFQLLNTVPSTGIGLLSALPIVREAKAKDLTVAAVTAAADFASTDPLANLNEFQTRKIAYDVEANTPLPPLSGGAGWRFYADSNIASNLRTGHPGAENTITAMMVFSGAAGDLAFLTELMP